MNQISPNDTESNVYKFALQSYKKNTKSGQIDYDDFNEDYGRYWFVIKLLVVYRNSGEVNVRLLFNHLIILTNNFGAEAAQILLSLALDKGDYDVISLAMTALNCVGYIPDDKFMTIINEEYLLNDIPISTSFVTYINKELFDENI